MSKWTPKMVELVECMKILYEIYHKHDLNYKEFDYVFSKYEAKFASPCPGDKMQYKKVGGGSCSGRVGSR